MPKKIKRCQCLEKANEALAASNVKLTTMLCMDMVNRTMSIDGPYILVEHIRVLRNGKPLPKIGKPLPKIVCTFCPICGKRLRPASPPNIDTPTKT